MSQCSVPWVLLSSLSVRPSVPSPLALARVPGQQRVQAGSPQGRRERGGGARLRDAEQMKAQTVCVCFA